MTIDRRDSLVGARLEELARDYLFHCQDHAVLASNTDSCSSILDSLHSVFNLEIPAIWREDRVGEIVSRAD
jgi:hypothetical protein